MSSCNRKVYNNSGGRNAEKKIFSKSVFSKIASLVKWPTPELRAIKKQKADKRKQNRDLLEEGIASRKRTLNMQTPEVQERMRQDKIKRDLRDKERLKKKKARAKEGRIKYT